MFGVQEKALLVTHSVKQPSRGVGKRAVAMVLFPDRTSVPIYKGVGNSGSSKGELLTQRMSEAFSLYVPILQGLFQIEEQMNQCNF